MSRPHLKPVSPEPTAPKRRQSKRGLETERKLLSAAEQVFWQHGYSGATIMQIIEASGLSVGSFYHRFADKDELLEAATGNVSTEFQQMLSDMDFSREANGDLFTLFFRLVINGRELVARNRGIYRALVETVQSDITRFGTLTNITPQLIAYTRQEIGGYADQMTRPPEAVSSAVQLVTMTVMQTELGLGPSFPQDPELFAQTLARACCGILGYNGQTAHPVTEPEP